MTVGGFWPFYKKRVGFGTISVEDLRDKKISTDVYGTLYEQRIVSKKSYLSNKIDPFHDDIDDEAIDNIWIGKMFNVIIGYLMNGIYPIIVFDGEKDPMKLKTLQDRTNDVNKAKKRVGKLKRRYRDTDFDDIPKPHREELISLLCQIDRMPEDSMKKFTAFAHDIGIPYVLSKEEAERTASLMNRDGLTYAVLSKDSDCMACGAKLVLKEKTTIYDSENRGSHGYITANEKDMLAVLGMDRDLFVELCIMSGTDFNENVENIGIGKSYNYLLKHRSISNIGKNTAIDISVLNHREVRKKFQCVPWQETASFWRLDFHHDEESAAAALERYKLEHHLDTLIELKNNVSKQAAV